MKIKVTSGRILKNAGYKAALWKVIAHIIKVRFDQSEHLSIKNALKPYDN